MLGVASIGAAKLHLATGGLALPSYSDSAKVAYVLQGKSSYIMHSISLHAWRRSDINLVFEMQCCE
jgi:hypothetical protein